jgi:hypothetical protein
MNCYQPAKPLPDLVEFLNRSEIRTINTGYINFYIKFLLKEHHDIPNYEEFWLTYPFQDFILSCDIYLKELKLRVPISDKLLLEHIKAMSAIHRWHNMGAEIAPYIFNLVTDRLSRLVQNKRDILPESEIITLPAMAMILHYTLKDKRKARSFFDAAHFSLRLTTGLTAESLASLRSNQVQVSIRSIEPLEVSIRIIGHDENDPVYSCKGNPVDPARYLSNLNLIWNCINWYALMQKRSNISPSELVALWELRHENEMFFDTQHHSQANSGKKSSWCQKMQKCLSYVEGIVLRLTRVKESIVVNYHLLQIGSKDEISKHIRFYMKSSKKVPDDKTIEAGIKRALESFYVEDIKSGLLFLDESTSVNKYYNLEINDADGFANKTLSQVLHPLGLEYNIL